MNKRDEFLKTQKILRLCTIDKKNFHTLRLYGIDIVEKKFILELILKVKKLKILKKITKYHFV